MHLKDDSALFLMRVLFYRSREARGNRVGFARRA